MKRAGIFLLSTCLVVNMIFLPVSASGENPVTDEPETITYEENETLSENDADSTDEDSSAVTENSENVANDDADNITEDSEESVDEDNIGEEEAKTEVESVSEIEEDSLEEEGDLEEPVLETNLEETVLYAGNTVWNESKKLTQNTTVNGNLIVEKSLDLNGFVLTVNGNMTSSANVTTGQYGKLTVNGDYVQKSGSLSISSGSTLDVSRNLKVCGIDANGNEVTGTSSISSHSTGIRNIGGDFILNTSNGAGNSGIINLNGNLVDGPTYFHNLSDASINFNGTKQQLIDIGAKTALGTINGTNDDIKVKKYFSCHKLLKNLTLKADGDVIYFSDSSSYVTDLDINGFILTVPVSVVAEGGVQTGVSGKLVVDGDYVQKTNSLSVSSGSTLDISGDLKVCGIDANGNEVTGTSKIWSHSTGIRNIGGNFILNTSGDAGNAGTINLNGNIVDGPTYFHNLSDASINFNGTKQQLIDIGAKTALGTINGTNDNIKVKKNFSCHKLEKNLTLKADGDEICFSDSSNYVTDLNINGYILTVPVSVVAEGGVQTGVSGKLVVDGDYVQKSNALSVGSGSTLDVSGDLKACGIDANGNEVTGTGSISSHSTGIRNIGGDFIINTSNGAGNNGIINLKGNLLNKTGKDLSYCTVNLIGNASKTNKQIVDCSAGGKISVITCKSCGNFYDITDGCYYKLEKPDHKYDKGVVIQPTTPTTQGIKKYTCEVCGEYYTEKIPRVQNVFSDVPTGKWYVNAIQYVYENDIMSGGNEKFNPSGKITREQFVQVLYNCEGKPNVTIDNPFSDVKKEKYYYNAVLWAKQEGISSGYANGTFGVGNNIKRQDLAKMLYEYAGKKGYNLTKDDSAIKGFSDVSLVSGYAVDAMNWAVTQGIMSGKNGRLDPKGNATRAECASMIMNLIEKNKK